MMSPVTNINTDLIQVKLFWQGSSRYKDGEITLLEIFTKNTNYKRVVSVPSGETTSAIQLQIKSRKNTGNVLIDTHSERVEDYIECTLEQAKTMKISFFILFPQRTTPEANLGDNKQAHQTGSQHKINSIYIQQPDFEINEKHHAIQIQPQNKVKASFVPLTEVIHFSDLLAMTMEFYKDYTSKAKRNLHVEAQAVEIIDVIPMLEGLSDKDRIRLINEGNIQKERALSSEDSDAIDFLVTTLIELKGFREISQCMISIHKAMASGNSLQAIQIANQYEGLLKEGALIEIATYNINGNSKDIAECAISLITCGIPGKAELIQKFRNKFSCEPNPYIIFQLIQNVRSVAAENGINLDDLSKKKV